MATAYQPTPRWEQSVPMGREVSIHRRDMRLTSRLTLAHRTSLWPNRLYSTLRMHSILAKLLATPRTTRLVDPLNTPLLSMSTHTNWIRSSATVGGV